MIAALPRRGGRRAVALDEALAEDFAGLRERGGAAASTAPS